MKETENVFIETQTAQICQTNRRAAVGRRDGGQGRRALTLFCKSRSCFKTHAAPSRAAEAEDREHRTLGRRGLAMGTWGTLVLVPLAEPLL